MKPKKRQSSAITGLPFIIFQFSKSSAKQRQTSFWESKNKKNLFLDFNINIFYILIFCQKFQNSKKFQKIRFNLLQLQDANQRIKKKLSQILIYLFWLLFNSKEYFCYFSISLCLEKREINRSECKICLEEFNNILKSKIISDETSKAHFYTKIMVSFFYPKSQNSSNRCKNKRSQVQNIERIFKNPVQSFSRIARHVTADLLDADSDEHDGDKDFVVSRRIAEFAENYVTVINEKWKMKQKAEKRLF